MFLEIKYNELAITRQIWNRGQVRVWNKYVFPLETIVLTLTRIYLEPPGCYCYWQITINTSFLEKSVGLRYKVRDKMQDAKNSAKSISLTEVVTVIEMVFQSLTFWGESPAVFSPHLHDTISHKTHNPDRARDSSLTYWTMVRGTLLDHVRNFHSQTKWSSRLVVAHIHW